MKSVTLLLAVLLSANTFAQTKFSECYNYAMATGNVYENQFTVVLNNEASESELLAVENVISTETFSLLSRKESSSRSYLTIKADLKDMYNVENTLEFLNNKENIQIKCKYIL